MRVQVYQATIQWPGIEANCNCANGTPNHGTIIYRLSNALLFIDTP